MTSQPGLAKLVRSPLAISVHSLVEKLESHVRNCNNIQTFTIKPCQLSCIVICIVTSNLSKPVSYQHLVVVNEWVGGSHWSVSRRREGRHRIILMVSPIQASHKVEPQNSRTGYIGCNKTGTTNNSRWNSKINPWSIGLFNHLRNDERSNRRHTTYSNSSHPNNQSYYLPTYGSFMSEMVLQIKISPKCVHRINYGIFNQKLYNAVFIYLLYSAVAETSKQ